jgi:hypothetical protein
MREGGVIRFGKMAILPEVRWLFFIRKAATRGGFSC